MSKSNLRVYATTNSRGILLWKVQKKLGWFPLWLTVGKYYTYDYALLVKTELEKDT